MRGTNTVQGSKENKNTKQQYRQLYKGDPTV